MGRRVDRGREKTFIKFRLAFLSLCLFLLIVTGGFMVSIFGVYELGTRFDKQDTIFIKYINHFLLQLFFRLSVCIYFSAANEKSRINLD